MKETNFIKQNKLKWAKLEQLLEQKNADPEQLNELFIQITDDLSYARTFYPNRSVRVYLNGLAQRIFQSIYKNQKPKRNKFVQFWTHDVPCIIYESRYAFYLSFILFAGAILVGILSCHYDPDFVRTILGDRYVEMTMENIRSGDPMRVYKDSDHFAMFAQITLNNLRVAFLTFIAGVVASIGTIFVLISNGVMVGSFQYFFFQQGVGIESMLAIWIHGTLEISAIIIAGAAGLTMGSGLLFPGTHSRAQAFIASAKRGLQIMLSITPIIIAAGFFEGFLTRYTDAPNFARLGIILSSLTFILLYYVYYPYKKHKAGFKAEGIYDKVPQGIEQDLTVNKIRSLGEILAASAGKIRGIFPKLIGISALMGLLYALILWVVYGHDLTANFGMYALGGSSFFNFTSGVEQSLQYFNYSNSSILFVLNSVAFTLITLVIIHNNNLNPLAKKYKQFFAALFVSVMLSSIFFLPRGFSALAILFLGGPLLIALFAFATKNNAGISVFGQGINLSFSAYGRVLGITTVLGLMVLILSMLLSSQLVVLLLQAIKINFNLEPQVMNLWALSLFNFLTISMLCMVFGFCLQVFLFLYHTLREIKGATSLKAELMKLGSHKLIYGLKKEELTI